MAESTTERAQAFTLEALIAGLILLMAILFSLQAVVVTPGAPGADVQPDIRQQAADVLDIADEEGALDDIIRRYDPDNETFAGAKNAEEGYGSAQPPTVFGELLHEAFVERGNVINVVIEYRVPPEDGLGTGQVPLIYQGDPPDASTVASTTITLYSNQTLTSEGNEDMELWEAVDEGYPIPDIAPDEPLHNVIHVRVVVW